MPGKVGCVTPDTKNATVMTKLVIVRFMAQNPFRWFGYAHRVMHGRQSAFGPYAHRVVRNARLGYDVQLVNLLL